MTQTKYDLIDPDVTQAWIQYYHVLQSWLYAWLAFFMLVACILLLKAVLDL